MHITCDQIPLCCQLETCLQPLKLVMLLALNAVGWFVLTRIPFLGTYL